MKPFDVHCHLYDESFDSDRTGVIKRAKKVLSGIIIAGEDPESNRKVMALSKEYPNFCYPSLGFHPTKIYNFTDNEIEKEFEWIKKQKPVAISEIGLDFAIIKQNKLSEFDKMRQIEWFERALQLANKLNVPSIIHSRWATKQVVEILTDLKPKKAVLHAFSGTMAEAKQALNLGYYFSIGNTIAYATQKQELAKILPLEAFVLETDSPVLAPIKGARNEPSNIMLVVKQLAKIKNVPESKIIETTNKNVKTLFKI
jgi:TatD DNase family protein